MKIEDLIKLPEGKTLEFKENASARAKILSTVIAFANTSGGQIVIGVKDKTRQLVGVQDSQRLAESLANMIHDSVEPKLLPNIEVISFRNKQLVSIEIYPSVLRPHYERSKGKFKSSYIRIGSTTRLADADLLKTIERSTIVKSFDEELCYAANYEEIDIKEVTQLFAQKRELTTKDLITLSVFVKDRENLIPTVGGVLLFSKNRLKYFPDAWMQLGVFAGKNKEEILSSQEITTLLPESVDEAINFIKKNIRVGLKIEDVRHTEVWEIPKIALREALVNAIVHSDYALRGAPIRVAIFTDRIEIENSGLLLWGLTIEDLKTGISKLRNPVIARVFKELGLIEQWGSGIQRMIKACEEAGLYPPLFEEIGARIRVTFFKESMKKPETNDLEEKIIHYLKEKDSLSTQEITSFLGLSKRTVINRLSHLVNKGIIVEISTSPTDPGKRYMLRE
jgi:predicted HTH transcriptional regulator